MRTVSQNISLETGQICHVLLEKLIFPYVYSCKLFPGLLSKDDICLLGVLFEISILN